VWRNVVFLFWRHELAASPRLKYASHWGSWGECSCRWSATAIHSVSVNRTRNLPVESRTLILRAIAALTKSLSPMPRWDVPLGRYWGTNDRRKRIKLDSCKAFSIRFWEEGQCQPRTTGALMFPSLRLNVIFDWDGGNGFVWRGRCL